MILFIACSTGKGNDKGSDLTTAAVARGAGTAVGFDKKIEREEADEWVEEFMLYMEDGYTVKEACDELSIKPKYQHARMDAVTYKGKINYKLTDN